MTDMQIGFLLNGEPVTVEAEATATLLDWLRDTRGQKGTKEGCNEGDCGACTVMVQDGTGVHAVNACILFLPQLHGKAVRTVEGITDDTGGLHPVQRAMVQHHGSQCGFCTPGFIASMATAHANGARDFNDRLAGNLCRCTGYAPIIRAAETAADQPVPRWVASDRKAMIDAASAAETKTAPAALPDSADALAKLLEKAPKTRIVGGGTDLGLWVTKQMRDLGPVAFVHRCTDMQQIDITKTDIRIGAGVTIERLGDFMADHFADFAEMIRRYGSAQVRAAATIGGNIANGSPIGDGPPVLMALGATLHLRKGTKRRSQPLEEFFLGYGKQDLDTAEFIEAVSIPRQPDRLGVYKISKRFDQDISAICGAINISVAQGTVISARIAFGGMAGVPKRATHVEAALMGQPWGPEGIANAWDAWAKDFTPMSDMRASAEYRLEVARNLLTRYFLEDLGARTRVLEVQP